VGLSVNAPSSGGVNGQSCGNVQCQMPSSLRFSTPPIYAAAVNRHSACFISTHTYNDLHFPTDLADWVGVNHQPILSDKLIWAGLRNLALAGWKWPNRCCFRAQRVTTDQEDAAGLRRMGLAAHRVAANTATALGERVRWKGWNRRARDAGSSTSAGTSGA